MTALARMKCVALILSLLATPLAAQSLRPEDQVRLQDFDASFGRGVQAALASGAEEDVARLVNVLRGQARPPRETDLTGAWNCRVMKLGGDVALVIYSPFPCEVADGRFRKTGGSQLTEGTLTVDARRMLYLGVGFAQGETPPAYDALPPITDPRDVPQLLPQVALVEQTGPDMARMLFPAPFVESEFDIIEMTR